MAEYELQPRQVARDVLFKAAAAGTQTTLEDVDASEIGVPPRCWFLRPLNAGEREAFERRVSNILDGKEEASVRCVLVSMTLCDCGGSRLIEPGEYKQIELLPASLVSRIFDQAQRMNGLGAKEIEDAEKNSESGPSDSLS